MAAADIGDQSAVTGTYRFGRRPTAAANCDAQAGSEIGLCRNQNRSAHIVEASRPIAIPAPPSGKLPDNGEGVCDPSEFNRQTHPERDPAPKP